MLQKPGGQGISKKINPHQAIPDFELALGPVLAPLEVEISVVVLALFSVGTPLVLPVLSAVVISVVALALSAAVALEGVLALSVEGLRLAQS
jgi:hypothetical protein